MEYIDSDYGLDINSLSPNGISIFINNVSKLDRFPSLGKEILDKPKYLIKTGYHFIDSVGGFDDLILIGGAKGLGKSAFSLQMLTEIPKQNPVIYYSLEMDSYEIYSRLFSRYLYLDSSYQSQIRVWDIRNNRSKVSIKIDDLNVCFERYRGVFDNLIVRDIRGFSLNP